MAASTDGGSGLFDTVVKLANFGFAGIGIIVALLVFIILMRGTAADPGTDRLRHRFLTWGFSFAGFCGILSLLGPWLAPPPVNAGPTKMRIDFSPDFKSNGLPNPAILLPSGGTVSEGALFEAHPGPLLIRMDDALKQVADLRVAALKLAENAKIAQDQADQAVALLVEKSDGKSPGLLSMQSNSKAATAASKDATANLAQSIKAGQLGNLQAQSNKLNTATMAGIKARDDVIKAARQ
jgi:hypothetical protein